MLSNTWRPFCVCQDITGGPTLLNDYEELAGIGRFHDSSTVTAMLMGLTIFLGKM